jgi:hypothetical protein
MKSAIDVPRKANGTSVLKILPDKRQAAILEYYETHKGTDTVKWLADDGIATYAPSLSQWRIWYLERRLFDRRATSIASSLLDFRRLYPHITKEELDKMGELIFNALAIKQKDIKTWNLAQQIQLKRERQVQQQQLVDNATRMVELELRKYKDQQAKTAKKATKTGPSAKERKAAVRKILGISQ